MKERKPTDWEAVEREYRAGVLSVREIANGAGSVLEDWDEAKFEAMAARLSRARHASSERGVVQDVLLQLSSPLVLQAYHWPAVTSIRTEYSVPRGRIDVLAFHEDGSGTIIECKASMAAKDILPAIGQVMAYGVEIEAAGLFTRVRLAIASRVCGEDIRHLRSVYQKCGIEPMFCIASQACADLARRRAEGLEPV